MRLSTTAMTAVVAVVSFSLAHAEVSIQWQQADNGRQRVEVSGLSAAELASKDADAWADQLAVFAEPDPPVPGIVLPPMVGTYAIQGATLVFTPLFPLQPGLHYRARFVFKNDGDEDTSLDAPFHLRKEEQESTTEVAAVYPSSNVLSENLLKFYLHFSAPMSRGDSYRHIRLANAQGDPVELPFLEIDEELWNPKMTRLTLFIDPGRIKRGVRPLEEIGPALEAGKEYTLSIAADWKDARGMPLKASFQKKFVVVEPDRTPPNPDAWRIQVPEAGTRNPLEVTFTDPMDHALTLRMLHVFHEDARIEGSASLTDFERTWRFVPSSAWTEGSYQLVIQTTIEDLAGNNIGKPFEVDVEGTVQRTLKESSVRLPFRIGSM